MIPSEEEVLLLLGHVVYEAQETEATVHLSLSVISGLPPAESIEQLKAVYEKKTLGQFFVLVRSKIGVSTAFDEYMKDYVDQRNFIIHNLSRTSSFSLFKEDGRLRLMNFLTNFRHMNRKVNLTFVTLTEAWMRVLHPQYALDPELKEFRESELFQEIIRDFVPQLPAIFGGNLQAI